MPAPEVVVSRLDRPGRGAETQLPKHIVYVLKTASEPTRYYTGLTSDVARRLDAHNAGGVPHTARYTPWMIDVVVLFGDESRAVAFERYLKSGSGSAFAQRHLR